MAMNSTGIDSDKRAIAAKHTDVFGQWSAHHVVAGKLTS